MCKAETELRCIDCTASQSNIWQEGVCSLDVAAAIRDMERDDASRDSILRSVKLRTAGHQFGGRSEGSVP